MEQPLPADADDTLARLELPIQLCADESCPGASAHRAAPGAVLEQDEFSCGPLPWFRAARAVRQEGKWNRKSRRTRKGRGALQGQDHALDLKARLAGVE
jgi:hypothetical protein